MLRRSDRILKNPIPNGLDQRVEIVWQYVLTSNVKGPSAGSAASNVEKEFPMSRGLKLPGGSVATSAPPYPGQTG